MALEKLNTFFLIKNDQLLEKYNNIWEKISNTKQKEFYGKPVSNKQYLKTKVL